MNTKPPVEPTNIRLYAAIHARVLHPRTSHVVGSLSEAIDRPEAAQPLPSPDILVIEKESEGNVFLYRLTRSGEAGGDTWHPSVEEAKEQAEYEYGATLDEWRDVPTTQADARAFAVRLITEQ